MLTKEIKGKLFSLFLCLTLLPAISHAKIGISPFIGVSYHYSYVAYPPIQPIFEYTHGGEAFVFANSGGLPTQQQGGGLEAGIDFNRYIGFAIGLNHFARKNSTIKITAYNSALPQNQVHSSVTVKISMNEAFLELRLYYPLLDKIKIIATIGPDFLERDMVRSRNTVPFPSALNNHLPLPGDDSGHMLNRLLWRFGLGLSKGFSQHCSLKLIFHYISIPNATIISNAHYALTGELGFDYRF